MLDTIRFKIEGSEEIYNRIKLRGNERLIWDYENDTQKHVLVFQLIPFKDSLYKIYIQAQSTENFFVEFSLPKIMFGTNIFMIYPKQLVTILLEVKRAIEIYLNVKIASPNEWIVQRVDYSYVWKFDNKYKAKWALESISNYNYPRKGTTKRETSFTIDGTTEKIIFYLKQDEFRNKGYKNLVKNGYYELADWLYEKSEATLRFEIVHKKPKLNSIFGGEVNYEQVTNLDYIIDLMNSTLTKLCNTERYVPMTHEEMTEAIYNKYSKKEAYNLFGFANIYHHWDMARREFNRKFLKDIHSSSLVSKNLAKLKDAGVDILVASPHYKAFDLSIPNKNAINTVEEVASIAAAIRDLYRNRI